MLRTWWKDINKGDVEKPTSEAGSWTLTSTPIRWTDCSRPPESLKLLVSNAATVEKCRDSAFKEEIKAIMVNDVAIAFFEAGVEKRDCNRKTVEDQGAQWWGCCKNHCTVQERYSRELPERNSEIHERSRFSFGKVQRKYIFPRSSK